MSSSGTFRASSVRARISIAAAVVFAIALSLTSWLLVSTVSNSLRDGVRDEGEVAIAEYERRLRNGTLPHDLPQPTVRSVTYLQVLDANGNVIGGSPGYGNRAGPPDVRASEGEPERRVDGNVMYTYTRVTTSTGRPLVLVASSNLDQVRRSIDALSATLWLVMPLLVLVVGGVAWVMTGRALRPVEAIRAEVELITATSLERRVPEPGSDDEIGALAHTMNQMLDRLEDAARRQRLFLSDASHELRSPVASIRTTGEVALAHPTTADWPRVVEQMLSEDERMGKIVADLLLVARDDEGTAQASNSEIDLDDLVFEEAARITRLIVKTDQVSAGRVLGSREQLGRMVSNLLDNASRHANTNVAVSLQTVNSRTVLTIDDDGPGIDPHDRERVFERFTRLDEGRARDSGGIGLGLAMVRSIVDGHGGTVAIDSAPAPLGGARIVVDLPSYQGIA